MERARCLALLHINREWPPRCQCKLFTTVHVAWSLIPLLDFSQQATVRNPRGIILDNNGDGGVLIADGGGVFRKLWPNGTITRTSMTGFLTPYGIVSVTNTLPGGGYMIADQGQHVIKQVHSSDISRRVESHQIICTVVSRSVLTARQLFSSVSLAVMEPTPVVG